jgi:hypothetical protein
MKITAKIGNHTIGDVSFNGSKEISDKYGVEGTLQFRVDDEWRVVTGQFGVRNGRIVELTAIDDTDYELLIEGRNGDDLEFEVVEW